MADSKKILIIQENGRNERNMQFRECFALQRAFHYLGTIADVWGIGHENFHQPFAEIMRYYDAVISLENYDTGWHPNLKKVKVPRLFWCIDAHMGIERYVDFVRRIGFDIVLNATEHFVDTFKNIVDASLWLPNAYDSFLIDKIFGVRKTIPIGFCGNVVNRGGWIQHLKKHWDLVHHQMVIGPDMVRAVNSYQIHWNRNVSIDINYRTFETLGCRTFLLTNETPGLNRLFTPEKHLVTYKDKDDLDHKITYYLKHPKEREAIAREGYMHVRRYHRYISRAERILEILGCKTRDKIQPGTRTPIRDITEQMISAKQFLFLSGATKSGTTLLANALNLSDRISFLKNMEGKLEEGQWVQDVYEWGKGNQDLTEKFHFTEDHVLTTVDNRIRLFRTWSRYWDLSKPLLAEKSPHNVIKTRFLQALFPNSRFIILVRNGIVQATGEALQENRNPLICCQEWVRAYEILINDLGHIHQYLLVRYEDMTNNVEETFEKLCVFISIPPIHVNNRSFYVHAFPNGVKRPDMNSIQDMSKPHIENFIYRIDHTTQQKMFQICGPIMQQFGYSIEIADYHEYLKDQNHCRLLRAYPENPLPLPPPARGWGING
ncbi:MAG: glycosyltransferase [Deltaproteobacteria bacterium]|nr:glycosyltransferase [Deltaproteobacteria bacterium]